MLSSSWYQENITFIKYWLIVVNIFFMIIAIRAVVNRQLIIDSIEQVTYDTQHTKDYTDYINNFLSPYLKSEFAPYFLAHENNQIFPWEKIIKIIIIPKNDTDAKNRITIGTNWNTEQNKNTKRRNYISWLLQDVRFGTIIIPFYRN